MAYRAPNPLEQLHFVGAPNSPFRTRRTGVTPFQNGVAYEISYHVRVQDNLLLNNRVVDHVLEWTKFFEKLLDELKAEPDIVTSEKSKVRLVVDGGQLNSGIVISVLPIHDPFTSSIIMERIAGCIQSGDRGMTGDDIKMLYVGIYNPIEGDGQRGVVQSNVKGKASKKSMIPVATNSMCLAKAVLIGEGFVKNGIPMRNWQANVLNKKLEASALILHTATVGEASTSGGITNIPKMEEIFAIRICVVSALTGRKFLYPGNPQYVNNGTVYLYHSDHHFDVITNIRGFLGQRHFCEYCLKGFRRPTSHSCPHFCTLCNRQNCTLRKANYRKVCGKCNYVFTTSLSCYLHHKKPRKHNAGFAKSLCERRWRCPICSKSYEGKKTEIYAAKHQCYQKYCRFCKRYTDRRHICYHRSYQPSRSSQKFMFLDFECDVVSTVQECDQGYCPPTEPNETCQDCRLYGAICNTCRLCQHCKKRTCGMQLHVPNFCVIQKTCDLCYKNENLTEVGCDGCGNRCVLCGTRDKNGKYLKPCCNSVDRDCSQRETVFSGENVTQDVGDYIFQAAHKGFKLFAHNMSRYDGCFLMNYVLANGIVPKHIIYRGTKCILWTVPKLNIKVMDTLNFLSMKLNDLPACLGVDISLKKYFPIWFNDNRHRTYVGPFPAAEYFDLEGMDRERRADFDAWYNAQKDETFDLQKTLYEYCSHDVCLLRKCALKFQTIVKEITQQSVQAKNFVTGEVENVVFEGFDPFANSVTLPQMCQKIYRYLFLTEVTNLKITGEARWLKGFQKGGKFFCHNEGEKGEEDYKLLYFPKSVVEHTYFKKSKISQLNPGGNVTSVRHSKISLYFMYYLEKRFHDRGLTQIEIQHAGNGRGEKKIELANGRLASVDGYYQVNGEKHVIEFHGCFPHSCKKCFPTNRHTEYHPFYGISLHENYEATLARDARIRNAGFKLLTVWECSFRKFLAANPEISDHLSNLDLTERLYPRDALYGGRCEAFTLYCHPEKMGFPAGSFIDYYDFVSLYPSVQFAAPFPVGHYTVITKDFGPLDEYFGLVKARVSPPSKNLHIPVLPQRINGRLVFALCQKCATNMVQEKCCCTEKERSWIGTYTTVELLEAVKYGYKVEKIYEIYHYYSKEQYSPGKESSVEGLFAGYIQTFLKLKAESSGWPAYCTSPESKKAFVEEYYDKYGVVLDTEAMLHNKGRRTVSKYCLNTLWGLYCQRPNPQVMTIYGKEELPALVKLMDSSTKTVTNFTVVNNETLHVEWKYKDAYAPANCNRNVILGLFVTSYARLKLNKVMQENPADVLYCDTDSVFRLNRRGRAPRTNSSLLGELANELKPSEVITEFVSTGSKCYAYSTSCDECVIKAKGFYMTRTLHDKINLKSMLELLDGELEDRGLVPIIKEEEQDLHSSPLKKRRCIKVSRPRIRRDKRRQAITTEQEYKTFSCVFTKRILYGDYSSRPYGWRSGNSGGET